ncbi:YcgN family cysteine cluster protein [Granulosicoccus sp.]|nr:YcgN family cysteine cluster protein [Granulosicoccus sp.]MDB4223008.1 YcgN family cysteine cluster protein [Granulosicoccus sp.]
MTKFWETTSLNDMSDTQWESLCDGCGRCCLQKLEDEDTGEVHFTRVSCRLLNTDTCRCSNYPQRFNKVPDCLSLRPLTEEKVSWLPESCAYAKLSHGKPLEYWHPLISGSAESVKLAGISVSGQCISEEYVPVSEIYEHIIQWNNDEDNSLI